MDPTSNKKMFDAQVQETLRLFKIARIAVKDTPCVHDEVKQFVLESLSTDLQRVRATAMLVEQGVEAAQKLGEILESDPDEDDAFDDALRQIRNLPEAER